MASHKPNEADSTRGIVPHTKIKGVDIAGYAFKKDDWPDSWHLLIFRSDLGPGLYMEAYLGNEKPQVKEMPPQMKGADHYFCRTSKDQTTRYVYMIKGNSAVKMKLDEFDKFKEQFTLHQNCRGGDHYLGYSVGPDEKECFAIIFQKRGEFRIVHNLETDEGAKVYPLADECKNAIYFWGYTDSESQPIFYFLNEVNEWNRIPMHATRDLQNFDDFLANQSLPDQLVDFLPGGISLSIGPCSGSWSLVKSIDNAKGETPIKESKKVSVTIGHDKSVSETVGRNWEISSSVQTSVKAWIMEASISFSAKYGGSQSSTQAEHWNESLTTEESVEVAVEPKQSAYIWQYICNVGATTALFCKNLKVTKTPTAPTDTPLLPSTGP